MNPNLLRELTGVMAVGSGAVLGVKDLETLVKSCHRCIRADIESRTGLKDVWLEISDETKTEIIDTWMLMSVVNIASVLKTAASTEPTNLSDGHKTQHHGHDSSQ